MLVGATELCLVVGMGVVVAHDEGKTQNGNIEVTTQDRPPRKIADDADRSTGSEQVHTGREVDLDRRRRREAVDLEELVGRERRAVDDRHADRGQLEASSGRLRRIGPGP